MIRDTSADAPELMDYVRGPNAPLGVSQSDLMTILNTISDIVFTVCADRLGEWRFSMVNQRFLEATGLKPQDVFNQRVADVIPPASLPMVLDKYREATQTKGPVQWEELSVYPSGPKLGHVTIVALRDQWGVCTRIVGWVHDVTECARRAALVRDANHGT